MSRDVKRKCRLEVQYELPAKKYRLRHLSREATLKLLRILFGDQVERRLYERGK